MGKIRSILPSLFMYNHSVIQNFYAFERTASNPTPAAILVIIEKKESSSNTFQYSGYFSKEFDNFFDSHHYATTYCRYRYIAF